MDRDDNRLCFIAIENATKAQGLVDAYHNNWWGVCPERGLIFYDSTRKGRIGRASPQCNQSESTARLLLGKSMPWAEVRQIPLVLKPVDYTEFT